MFIFRSRSAHKWAIAANRSDLLEKKLESITKYFLCAEHFTDDCFMDPPNNTKLKKTIYPVSIPIPTKFESNFSKYVPQRKTVEYVNVNNKFIRMNDANRYDIRAGGVSLLNKSARAIGERDVNEIRVIGVCSDGNIQFVNRDESNEQNIDCCVPDNFDLIIEEECQESEGKTELEQVIDMINVTCRLCANCFHTDDGLLNIFSDAQLAEKVNRVMPNSVGHQSVY